MSRVLLISTNTCIIPYPVYPLGMSTVAGALAAAGHEVRQFDWLVCGRRPESLRETVETFAPEVVAISIRNIDHVDSLSRFEDTWELKEARDVVSAVRRLTDAPVVAGGPAVSVMPEQVLAYVGADCVVSGEGERSIVELLDAIARGVSVSGVWPVPADRLCGESQCGPLFERTLVDYYNGAGGIIGLQGKRGCPYRCSYCTYPALEGGCFRARPAEAVVSDMERLKRDFDVDTIFFADSVFNDPAGRYLELAEALARRDIGLRWAAYFSPRGLDREAVSLCRRAGLYAVEMGTDASSDTTLAGMGKPFRWPDVRHANDILVEARIACAHFIIFGGPDETESTVREGLDNIAQLDRCVVFGFSGIRIYPGTPLLERAISEGVIDSSTSLFKPVYYSSPKLDKSGMEKLLTESWSGRSDRVFPPEQGSRIVAKLRGFGWKGLLWDRMIRFDSDSDGAAGHG